MYLSMGVCMWVQVPVGTRDISAPWSYGWLLSPHAWVLRPPFRTVSPLTPEPSLPSPDTQISKCGTWWVLTNIHDEVITRVRIAPSFHVLPSEHRHMKSSKVELWVKSIPPSQSTSSVGLLPRFAVAEHLDRAVASWVCSRQVCPPQGTLCWFVNTTEASFTGLLNSHLDLPPCPWFSHPGPLFLVSQLQWEAL